MQAAKRLRHGAVHIKAERSARRHARNPRCTKDELRRDRLISKVSPCFTFPQRLGSFYLSLESPLSHSIFYFLKENSLFFSSSQSPSPQCHPAKRSTSPAETTFRGQIKPQLAHLMEGFPGMKECGRCEGGIAWESAAGSRALLSSTSTFHPLLLSQGLSEKTFFLFSFFLFLFFLFLSVQTRTMNSSSPARM